MTTIPRKSRSNFHSPSFKSPDRCDNTAIGTFWDFVENCPPPTKGARTARASAHSSSAPRACSVPSALVSGNALPARRHTRRCRARFREQTVPRARPLPAAYSVLVQYADKHPTVEWNGVGHFRQQAAGYAARRGEFVDIRAALQLGSGLMANSLRGTRTRIQVWIPSVSVLHVHSCGTPAWKQVDGKLFARYLYPNTSVDSKCLCAACALCVVHSKLKAEVFPACRITGASSRGYRAALQLGSGLMVSQMANYLRGTAVPEYKCGFQVSLCTLSVPLSVHVVYALWLLPLLPYGMIP